MIGKGVAKKLIDQLNTKYGETTETLLNSVSEKINNLPDYLSADFKKMLQEVNEKYTFYWDLLRKYNRNFYKELSLADLKDVENKLFNSDRNDYDSSFENPDVTEKLFGAKFGSTLNFYFNSVGNLLSSVRSGKKYSFNRSAQLTGEILNNIDSADSMDSLLPEVKETVISWFKNFNEDMYEVSLIEAYDNEVTGIIDFVNEADLSDERYLYQYLRPVSENEIGVARFLASYDEKELEALASNIVKAYIRSFELDKKDLTKKSTVRIIYNMGQEKLIRRVVALLKENGLDSFAGGVVTTPANKQMDYDHRFDTALILDESYMQKQYDLSAKVYEKHKEIYQAYSGPVFLENFGEKTFSPVPKKSCLKYNEDQQKLSQKFGVMRRSLIDKYVPSDETNFCIVAFPVPEIGENFEEIYRETIKINMLDSEVYEKMQKNIIDLLDKADHVHVKGKDGNKTDIKVKMPKIANPEKETNFNNCGATVNIPVGEVFTSPQLTETNGVLHVKETYLNELRYENIEIKFKDGFVEKYTCTNFESEEENQKYIQENLLFPHKTLPLGEFAIGTNTLAYAMAQKYKILNLLPILIVEKMGPHFAIGDTCYSWSEDFKVFNPIDNKEITARDNEKSILRKEDVQKAYTNCHTDITLPYEELAFITAVSKDGEEYEIIKDGKFMVKGCEELNLPLA